MTEPRLPRPPMRDEFRRELRARLIAEANATLPRARRGTSWTFLRPAFGVALAGVVLLAGAGTAAAGSLPGDPAFGLKQAIENVQVTLTFDDTARLRLLADIADRRLGELEQVSSSADKAPVASQEYADAVARFRAELDTLQQTAPAQKADAAQELADAARDKHVAILDQLEQKVPDQAKPALERARDEEQSDNRGKGHGNGQPSARPSRSETPEPTSRETPEPTRSPRASETSRGTERPEPTANPTARPSETPERSD